MRATGGTAGPRISPRKAPHRGLSDPVDEVAQGAIWSATAACRRCGKGRWRCDRHRAFGAATCPGARGADSTAGGVTGSAACWAGERSRRATMRLQATWRECRELHAELTDLFRGCDGVG